MLVLTRKCDESIVIADNVQIRVLRIQGNRVRLGIQAPKDIRIQRVDPSDEPVAAKTARVEIAREFDPTDSTEITNLHC